MSEARIFNRLSVDFHEKRFCFVLNWDDDDMLI